MIQIKLQTISGIDGLDLSEWEKIWNGVAPNADLNAFIELLVSVEGIDGISILEFIAELAIKAFKENIGAYSIFIAITLLSGIVGLISSNDDGVGKAAEFMCFGIAAGIGIKILTSMISLAINTINQMNAAMETITPVLAVVLAGTGSTVAGTLLQPASSFISMSTVVVFKNMVLPAILAAGIVAAYSGFAGSSAGMFGLFKSAVKWLMGAVFAVYFGIVAIQGITVARADSIALRTARYTIDRSIPIVGGAVSGSLDSILASTSLIKDAAGAAGAATAVAVALSPLINVACAGLCCRAAAALCEPLGNKQISVFLSRMAEVMNMLFAVVTAVAIMFIMAMGLTFAAGNP